MKRTLIALLALAATVSTPAMATGSKHKHYCRCGHSAGSKNCGGSSSSSSTSTSSTSSSSSGGSSSGGSSSGGTSTSSGGSSSSTTSSTSTGGTKVPEPGMLGLMGLTLVGLGMSRRRQGNGAA
ncbi:PEP-CTERM sorting domain-containing protein [Novosphingobium flavum]|uniref:PEP-CTERM sorting domain-containing protein n=1 Tax=Novosphingobium aerophilum TaxID=2839843 RepID=A0A7X1KCV0_9SPHN|nr:PEP-CTERM sorting domain-containing protein [Novosphingobium aerophilum]MBC2660498.1 PEP-CTERM sorting domain-containing protein [Novosphingobium aerophilum]